MNLKAIKKTSMMLAATAIFATTAFAQDSSAITITPPTDDFTVQVGSAYTPNPGISLQVIKTFGSNESISFLSFDLSKLDLTGQTITSAKLHVYGQGYGSVNLVNLAQDDWVNGNEGTARSTSETTLASLSSIIGSSNLSNPLDTVSVSSLGTYTFNISNLTDLINNAKDLSYYSLALKASNESEFTASFFSPKEYGIETAAVLELGLTPVPEPSSMIMGVLGLSSLLGLRRNKK